MAASEKSEQLDRIEKKLDLLLARTENGVEQQDMTVLSVVRVGDTSLIPSDHELRKRTPVRS